MARIALLAALALAPAVLVAWAQPAPGGLLFALSFEESCRPTFAVGPTTGDASCTLTTGGGGWHGEALIAERGFRGIEPFLAPRYLTAGNIDREQGTVTLAVQPLPEFFRDAEVLRCLFFSWVEADRKTAPKVFRIDSRQGMLRVFEQDVAGGNYTNHMTFPIPDWQPGQWHRIVYTWGGGERVLYLDGAQVARSAPGRGLPRLGHEFLVGAGAWGMSPAQGLIDEVAIYDRPLDADQVRGDAR